MTIKTLSDIKNMTLNYYITQPMQAVEMKVNIIIAKKPNLKNSLNRFHDHPLIRKYSHIPFNIK